MMDKENYNKTFINIPLFFCLQVYFLCVTSVQSELSLHCSMFFIAL